MSKIISYSNWNAKNIPHGISFDAASGVFSGSPNVEAGEYLGMKMSLMFSSRLPLAGLKLANLKRVSSMKIVTAPVKNTSSGTFSHSLFSVGESLSGTAGP